MMNSTVENRIATNGLFLPGNCRRRFELRNIRLASGDI